MAWSAGTLWLICISRDGMRNILVPLFAAMLLWALLRWIDQPGRRSALVAGAVAGAGLWTYQPLKLTPLLVAALLGWLAWQDRPLLRRLARGLGWFALAYVVVSAPMLLTAIFQPDLYFGRAVGVSVFSPYGGGVGLLDHTWRTLLMFTTTGDPNQRHDIAELPMLGWPLFLVACAGVMRAWRRRRDGGHGLILLGTLVFLIPPLLAVDGGVPHFLRSVGMAPFLAGLVGLGVAELVELARRLPVAWSGTAARASLAALLLVTGTGGAAAYFSRPLADRYDAYSYDVVAAARESRAPGSALVMDDYPRYTTDFLDASSRPEVFAPGSRIDNPTRFKRVVALSQKDLADALGPDAAGRAEVVERDPRGDARVWAVAP